MTDKDVLQAALDLLGWGVERLRDELNAEVEEGASKIANSTIYRWLSGSAPIHPGVKLFLRERLINNLPVMKAPRDLTIIVASGIGGIGTTPICYTMAACAQTLGVKVAVLDWEVETRGFKCTWRKRASSHIIARSIIRDESRLGPWTNDYDLVIVDAPVYWASLPEIHEKSELKTPKNDMLISLIQQADNVLLCGGIGDERIMSLLDVSRIMKSQGTPVSILLKVQAFDEMFFEFFRETIEKTDIRSASLIHEPLNLEAAFSTFFEGLNFEGLYANPLTSSMAQFTAEYLSRLGWKSNIITEVSTAILPRDLSATLKDVVATLRLN